MTWGELKAALEAAGVPDDAEVEHYDSSWGSHIDVTEWTLTVTPSTRVVVLS